MTTITISSDYFAYFIEGHRILNETPFSKILNTVNKSKNTSYILFYNSFSTFFLKEDQFKVAYVMLIYVSFITFYMFKPI